MALNCRLSPMQAVSFGLTLIFTEGDEADVIFMMMESIATGGEMQFRLEAIVTRTTSPFDNEEIENVSLTAPPTGLPLRSH